MFFGVIMPMAVRMGMVVVVVVVVGMSVVMGMSVRLVGRGMRGRCRVHEEISVKSRGRIS